MTKAAELLGLQQAALSKSIKKLEDSIDKKLFIRLGRGVKPTEYGLLLEKELRALQGIWQERMEQGLSLVESLAGVYTFAIHPTVAISSLAPVFSKVLEPHPHLKCELVFSTSKEALKKVVAHEADLAVVVKPEAHPELIIKPLHREKVFLYKSNISDKGVKAQQEAKILYYHPDMVSLSQVLKKYQKYKKIPIANYEVLAHIGQKSAGLTLLPEPVAKRVGGLEPVSKAIGDVPLALIYRYDRLKTKGFEYLKSSLYEELKNEELKKRS